MLQPLTHSTCRNRCFPTFSDLAMASPVMIGRKAYSFSRGTTIARPNQGSEVLRMFSSIKSSLKDGASSNKDVGTFIAVAIGNEQPIVSAVAEAAAVNVPNIVSGGKGVKDHSWRWEESDDAVRAYSSLVILLALGNLPVLHATKLADLPYFVGLALVTIYIGAHRGLTTRQRQQISIKEGILAPVLASVSLFGFYLLIKYLPDFNVKAFLNAYFWMLGTFAIGGAAFPVLRKVGGQWGELSVKFDLPDGWLLDENGASITRAELAPTDILAVVLALGLSTAELASGHTSFTLNNFVATLVATDILQLIGPRSFRTAGLLLLGLLLYDVFWVFGSPKVVGDNVMLAVATSDMISGPTRILFPRIPGGGSTAEAAAAAFPFSLLGLGDIAIPGLLACLALRYDASRSTDMRARAVAAAEAISSALAALEPGATSRQIADATAEAAEVAYDRVADQEARQRTQSLDGTNADGGGSSGEDGSTAATAAAAANLGASILRGVSAAASGGAGGSAALGSARSNLGLSASGRAVPGSNPPSDTETVSSTITTSTSQSTKMPLTSGQNDCASTAAATVLPAVPAPGEPPSAPELPRMAVSEAVLYQRTYFTPVMFAYVLGLVGAFIANDITGLGQPALLYIVPATLGAVVLVGVQRGELRRLWSFTDVPSYGLSVKEESKSRHSTSGADGHSE
ncbi:hypothetical protein VaNZ11_001072 [Volvox africanus]|uniref:Signal peptide peptidase n=1 Tax=Volvox africanus TaxID=51714 RepID=A0ABQ5RPJ2_9CHLO|nr:hypothetical protein VaNZ11_001072 [Volvox africanus]